MARPARLFFPRFARHALPSTGRAGWVMHGAFLASRLPRRHPSPSYNPRLPTYRALTPLPIILSNTHTHRHVTRRALRARRGQRPEPGQQQQQRAGPASVHPGFVGGASTRGTAIIIASRRRGRGRATPSPLHGLVCWFAHAAGRHEKQQQQYQQQRQRRQPWVQAIGGLPRGSPG